MSQDSPFLKKTIGYNIGYFNNKHKITHYNKKTGILERIVPSPLQWWNDHESITNKI